MNTSYQLPNTSLIARTRYVKCSTCMALCDEETGCVTQPATEYFLTLVSPKLGILIADNCFVESRGKYIYKQPGLYDDNTKDSHKEFVAALKRASPGLLVFNQLGHCGNIRFKGYKISQALFNINTASLAEIELLIDVFICVAELSYDAGYDGVQLHAAHHHLLCQALSPYFNHRTDEYGPFDPAQRSAPFLEKIIKGIHSRIPDYPISLCLPVTNSIGADPWGCAHAVALCTLLTRSICFFEITSGGVSEVSRSVPCRIGSSTLYYKSSLQNFVDAGINNVCIGGGVRLYEHCLEALESGAALVGFARPFIRQVNFLHDFEDGTNQKCISCNKCVECYAWGVPVKCIFDPDYPSKLRK